MKSAIFVVILMCLAQASYAGEIKDSESASHANEAAQYQIVDTYAYPGFDLVQFNLAVLSHYSYILRSGKQALVIDPGRDVSAYLAYCKQHGLSIQGVFLTHSHADFVAGHTELMRQSGVTVYAGHKSGARFAHKAVREGSTFKVGKAHLKIIETPGHTPDGLCALVSSEDQKPHVLLTGDTLFIGSVGRPDLMGGTMSAARLASMAFDTWHNKLSKLPDSVAVFPAHGAGSLCGAHLSDEPTSTIGHQRRTNPYLKHRSRTEFITAVLDGLPEAPQYFKHNAAMNQKGPPLVQWKAAPKTESARNELMKPNKYYVVDIRDAAQYAKRHLPNSVNIGLRGRVETWVGIMVPWASKLVLVGGTNELTEAILRLHRIGYRASVLKWSQWQKSGLRTASNPLVQPSELYEAQKRGDSPIVVDVRLPNEWMGLRIGNVVNIPLNQLAQLSSKLEPTKPVVAVCNSAFRSSMAVGILERAGFTKATSLDGGSQAWIEAGYPTYSTRMDQTLASADIEKRDVRLPERISAAQLKRMLVDLPGTFEIIDIRPPQAFAEYQLPNSTNLHIADLITHQSVLVGTGPLVIVDRDGSLAMAAGGVLSQKTDRRIVVLYGGLSAYWRESKLPIDPVSGPGSGAGLRAPSTPAPAGVAPRGTPARPKRKAKKSAGC